MLSSILIQDRFNEYDFDFNTIQNHISKKENSYITNYNEYENNLIEEFDEHNYTIYENEVKYKIFEDISSVTKNNDLIELVILIPSNNNIISINKIKLSDKLTKYIKDIFINIGEQKIIRKENKENKILSKIIEENINKNIINCQNNDKIYLHILLDKKAINDIINKNIFVNYSYAIIKNKLKYC